jgi:hypothetical protein
MNEETTPAKRERKPIKKFYILIAQENRLITDLTAGEVAGFLSSGKVVEVFDQQSDNSHEFGPEIVRVNDKFQAKTVIAYQG